jgi:hypothetical protein
VPGYAYVPKKALILLVRNRPLNSRATPCGAAAGSGGRVTTATPIAADLRYDLAGTFFVPPTRSPYGTSRP